MKTHVFRDLNYIPSPVTALCSNNSTIAALRRDHTCDFIDSTTHKCFIRFDVGFTITQASFIDQNTIIGLTECNKIIVMDIVTLEKQIFEVSATNISVIFNDIAYAERKFLYTTTKNEIYEMISGKSVIVYRESSQISTIYRNSNTILLGTKDGWIKTIKAGKCVSELEAGSTVNKIRYIEESKYIAILQNGSMVLFDLECNVILDKVSIRKHGLNVVEYFEGLLHVSGVDSRIISYSINNNKFSKVCQGDFHTSEVLCMAKDNDCILTSGEDSLIVANHIYSNKYTPTRIFDSSVKAGLTKDYFFVVTDKSADLYELPENVEKTENGENKISSLKSKANDKITFKISESVLENINQKQTAYNHFLKFNINKKLTSADISFDQKYLVYSTVNETHLYSLFTGSKLSISKIKEFPGAIQVLFFKDLLYMLDMNKELTVFDLNSFEIIKTIGYEDFRERILVNDKGIVFSSLKQYVKLPSYDIELLPVDDVIVSVSSSEDQFNFITVDESVCYRFIKIKENEVLSEVLLEGCGEVKEAVDDKIIYSNRYLWRIAEEGLDKYDFKNVIHSVIKYEGDLLIIQSCWSYLESKFKPSVFKEKYSN